MLSDEALKDVQNGVTTSAEHGLGNEGTPPHSEVTLKVGARKAIGQNSSKLSRNEPWW